jgi:hypothetical protein
MLSLRSPFAFPVKASLDSRDSPVEWMTLKCGAFVMDKSYSVPYAGPGKEGGANDRG